jgi:hypothetical protein
MLLQNEINEVTNIDKSWMKLNLLYRGLERLSLLIFYCSVFPRKIVPEKLLFEDLDQKINCCSRSTTRGFHPEMKLVQNLRCSRFIT